jgi:hypothetical protein
MKITKTINTATVNMATVAVKDGKAESKTTTVVIRSCDTLSDDKIAKAVKRIDPKATVVSVVQTSEKYAMDIDKFVAGANKIDA